jgi:hypothetical protein
VLSWLITLPVRIGLRTAERVWHASQLVTERAIGLVGQVIAPTAPAPRPGREDRGHDGSQTNWDGRSGSEDPSRSGSDDASRSGSDDASRSESDNGQSAAADPRSAAQPASETIEMESREPEPRPGQPAASPLATPPPAPEHVSDESTLVAEVAEPGAEGGAGAEIHVAEPWEGYDDLKAADVVDRISSRSAAELAAVELYERSHRRRQTVLKAVAGSSAAPRTPPSCRIPRLTRRAIASGLRPRSSICSKITMLNWRAASLDRRRSRLGVTYSASDRETDSKWGMTLRLTLNSSHVGDRCATNV